MHQLSTGLEDLFQEQKNVTTKQRHNTVEILTTIQQIIPACMVRQAGIFNLNDKRDLENYNSLLKAKYIKILDEERSFKDREFKDENGSYKEPVVLVYVKYATIDTDKLKTAVTNLLKKYVIPSHSHLKSLISLVAPTFAQNEINLELLDEIKEDLAKEVDRLIADTAEINGGEDKIEKVRHFKDRLKRDLSNVDLHLYELLETILNEYIEHPGNIKNIIIDKKKTIKESVDGTHKKVDILGTTSETIINEKNSKNGEDDVL